MKGFPTCCLALLLVAGPLTAQDPAPPTRIPPPPPDGPTRPGWTGDLKELIPPLLDALKDSDADVRQSAAGALAAIGQVAVAPLLKVFEDKDKDKDTRAGIAFVFGQMGLQGREALPALTKSLKDKEEDKDVRRKAVAAIALARKLFRKVERRYPGVYIEETPSGARPRMRSFRASASRTSASSIASPGASSP